MNNVNVSEGNIAALVSAAQLDDKEAFRGIFDHLSDRLFAYVVTRVPERDDALDIVQDTFIELWKALFNFQYKSNEQFYGFVFVIMKRRLYRYYKTRHKTVPLDDNLFTENFEMKTDDFRFLLKNMSVLSPHHQEILRLRYWVGMTFGEIAATLHMREVTAKVYHHRAIKKLRLLLQQYEGVM
jgi:RNA polymerase sigma factor (sigma-70 family)